MGFFLYPNGHKIGKIWTDMERYGKIWKDDDQLADLEVPDSRTKPDGQTFRNHFDLHWPMTGPKCVDAFS